MRKCNDDMYGYNVNMFISSNNFGSNKVSSIMRLNEIRIWYPFVSEKMSQMLRMERKELCMLMHDKLEQCKDFRLRCQIFINGIDCS